MRVAVPSRNSKIPLERKYGTTGAKAARLLVKARQAAKELGITFHVGSQTSTPEAFTTALAEVGKLIARAGVVLDRLDVGGGFPSVYDDNAPAPLSAFVRAIHDGVERCPIGERCRLMCEPGRALVAEAESLIVRVDARARQRALHQRRQLRHAVRCGAHGLQLPGPADRRSRASGASRWCRSRSGARPATPSTSCRARSMLPAKIREGDYIEIGNTGAYGRAIAGRFNGYGAFDEAILLDEPMLTMYPADAEDRERGDRRGATGPGVRRQASSICRQRRAFSIPSARMPTIPAPRGPWSSPSASRPPSATAAARRRGPRRSCRPASSSSFTTRSSSASPISTTAWPRCAQPPIAQPIEAALDQLAGIVEAVLEEGKFPFVLGGEHALTAGAIRPFAARHPDLVVLQLDAHADLRDGYLGERYSHAAAMRRVLDLPGVSLVSVGIRAISKAEVEFYVANRDRIAIHWAKDQAQLGHRGDRSRRCGAGRST